MPPTTSASDEALHRAEVGEGTPLMGGDIPLPDIPPDATWKERATAVTAGVGFGTSLLALLISPSPAVFVSGIAGMLLSPYAAFQQRKLTQVKALQETNVAMQAEVEQLQQQNTRLQEQETELGHTVLRLQELEDALEDIQSLRGASLKQLEEQLDESREILAQMDRNFKGQLLQNLMTVLLALDKDGNMMLSNAEIDELIQTLEGMHGVQLKEDLLKQAIIDHGRNVQGIMEVARNLLRDDIPPEESIFHFVEQPSQKQ